MKCFRAPTIGHFLDHKLDHLSGRTRDQRHAIFINDYVFVSSFYYDIRCLHRGCGLEWECEVQLLYQQLPGHGL